MPGIANLKTVSIPSVTERGQKITLSVIFENIGDAMDQFWVAADEYEGDITMNIASGISGATNLFNKRVEGWHPPGQLVSFTRDLVMPQKDKWTLRVTVGHYTDTNKTIQQIDEYQDVTILSSKLVPTREKTWGDSIH